MATAEVARRIVVDANVIVSFFISRHDEQRDSARRLLDEASSGRIVAIIPQFTVFEIAHVLRTFYRVPASTLAEMIGAITAFPGVKCSETCTWPDVLALWPAQIGTMTDAAAVSVARVSSYDALATFDRQLVRAMEDAGVSSYW